MSPVLPAAYRSLVSDACDLEPHLGWTGPADLQPLTPNDLLTVLGARDDLVLEEVVVSLDMPKITAALRQGDAALGAYFRGVLESGAREVLYSDVAIESEQRAEQDAREVPSRESEESRCGVATLFREVYR